MPTYDPLDTFLRDWARLSKDDQERFSIARRKFVHDLRAGGQLFRKSLRVKNVSGYPGIFEMTWAPDGRATFTFGTSPHEGEAHIIWRRIGSHEIFNEP